MFTCFNQSCAESGSLTRLVANSTGKNQFEVLRFILKKGSETKQDYLSAIQKSFAEEAPVELFPQEVVDRSRDAFWENDRAKQYMFNRGFDVQTLEDFHIGYSKAKDMIVTPMYNIRGEPVGVIGRGIDTKVFKNSSGLPRNSNLFNLNNAKKTGGAVIIVESAFDAMMVHQSGYNNVVAILGGNCSPKHFSLLEKHFDSVVIMTDFDNKESNVYKNCKNCRKMGYDGCIGHNPGRELGRSIVAGLRSITVNWAYYGDGVVYPNGAKDACDIGSDLIPRCIKNAISTFEYDQLGLD